MRDPPDRDAVIFTEALLLPIGERAAYLEQVCGSDAELRRKVEALLESHSQIGNFLEHSPQGVALPARPGTSVGEKPGDRIGHYKLLQQIGEGGCGIVFMAEQEQPVRRRVALKVIKPGMDTKSVIARFEAERQALALMDHPNIAKIFDAGTTDSGRPYFAMELIRGVKITEYCEQHSLTTEERLRLFVLVCKAVQHAHQKGIIHRDIKPSNILVTTTSEGTALPVVIDFGIAKATTNQRLTDKTLFTAFEMLIGTPAYMSPEQAELTSVDVDTRTDIYSLGVLLYELLTDSTPFDTGALLKAGLDEIRRVIREQEPARPSTRLSKLTGADITTVAQRRKSEPPTLIHAVRGDLDWIAMKALEKDRARRYETANDMALDIQRYLANEPVSARPPSKFYRLQKTVLRNKLLFAGIGIITLLLITGLLIVSASLAKERRSRRVADAASDQSQQVTQFLKAMLNGIGPSVARGRDTAMVKDILDQTAERINTEMTNQPAVQADLSGLVGKLYDQIGNYSRAEELYRNALAIRRKQFKHESSEVAGALASLGGELMSQHKLAEAETADIEALAIRRQLFGDENVETAASLNDLACVYRDERKLKEAEAMAQQALAIRRKLFGNEHLDVADSLRNLTLILGYEDKWADAESKAREVLAMRRKLLGPDSPSEAWALEDVAWAVNARGNYAEAKALEEQALAIRQKYLNEEHRDTARTLNALGQIMAREGKLTEAHGVLKGVLSIQKKVLGEDDPATLETFSRFAEVLDSEGKKSEAEAVWREAAGLWRKKGEIATPDALYTLRGLASALENEGKWPDAEAVWRESLASWRKIEGIEGRQSMYTLRKLALALESEQKWPEAEAVWREALLVSRKKGSEDAEALADSERLVRVLVTEKKFGEAEQLLNGILTPAFVTQPKSVDLLIRRLDLMGRQARWKEATADAALALNLQPTDHYRYHTLAGLLAITQDRPAYEQLCQKLFPKFANTTNPYIAERMAQDNLLLPHSGADLPLADKLADVALALGSGEDALPYFQACKSMSSYRQGHFPEAIEWGGRATASTKADALGKAKANAVLAMAYWQLGQKENAREMLAKGETLAPRITSAKGAVDLGDSWVAWIFARVSLDEATALIQPDSLSGDSPHQPQPHN